MNESNIVGSLTSLTLAYPELNDYSKEELEDILKNLTEFNRQLFIIFIKLFNNSEYNEKREEIILCEELNKLINTQDFIQIIEDNYSKDNLLKNTNFEEDKIILIEFKRIENELKNLSEINLESCKKDNEIIQDYLKGWADNYSNYIKDLEEAYYIKIGRENELKIKKKFNELKKKVIDKLNRIDSDFVKDLLNDVKEHLENIDKFDEENYLLTESDVNKALKDCDAFIDSQSKTLLIHFPNIEYDNDIKPITDFQKVYTLLIDFTSSKNLLEEIKLNKEKRICMNLGKLKNI